MEKEPKFSNWKEAWNYYASKSTNEYKAMSEDELIKLIQAGKWDLYYSIWSAIGENGTISKSAEVLLNVLIKVDGEHDDLIRYHCAGALFKILGIEDKTELRETVQWDLENRSQALKELEKIIKEKKDTGS